MSFMQADVSSDRALHSLIFSCWIIVQIQGERIEKPGRVSVLQIQDHKPDNDILVEGFTCCSVFFLTCRFTQANNLNEYVVDDFLVDDDAPIIYETPARTDDSELFSIHNLEYYSLPDSEFTASYPRRSARQHQRNEQRIAEREHREETIVLPHRHRRVIIESDEEDVILDSDESSEDETPIETSSTEHRSTCPSDASWTWPSTGESANVTPVLLSRVQRMDRRSLMICADSNEEGGRVGSSRSALLDFMQCVMKVEAEESEGQRGDGEVWDEMG